MNQLRSKLRLRSRLKNLQKTALVSYKLLRYEPALALRYGRPFVHSFIGGKLSVDDEFPLLALKATAFLDQLLDQHPIIFEYGAGGTTSYASQRAQRHVFVENIAGYYDHVVQHLRDQGRTNIEPHLVPPVETDAAPTLNPALPAWVTYRSTHQNHQGWDFTEYVKLIDQFPDRSFDLVLVDGRARNSCVYHALPKVRDGGYIMVDDSNRAAYQDAVNYLNEHFEPIHCEGLRAYHTMIHTDTANQQRTTFWKITHQDK